MQWQTAEARLLYINQEIDQPKVVQPMAIYIRYWYQMEIEYEK